MAWLVGGKRLKPSFPPQSNQALTDAYVFVFPQSVMEMSFNLCLGLLSVPL